MMKKVSALVIGSLAVTALASGCAVDAVESEDLVGTEEQQAQVCSNDQATNAILASMAVAMGREVRRWQPKTDLQFNYGTGMLELSATGKGRCANGDCVTMNKLLALQKPEAAGMNFGGTELSDPGVLRSRLWSYWDRQTICNNNPDQGRADQCPAESHELSNYRESTSGSTCAGGKDSWFKAVYAAGHPMAGKPLSSTDAAQLRNTLKWAGEAPGTGGNQYLQFEQDPYVTGDVKIDPLDGTTGGNSSTSGAVDVALNPVWKSSTSTWVCDATDETKYIGQPCTCNGINRSWQQKPLMQGWFVCK